MKHKILNDIIEQRNGHYVHALEVDGVNSLCNTIDAIYDEYLDRFNPKGDIYRKDDIKEFFNTIELYYYVDDTQEHSVVDENELYNFNIDSYIDDL